MDLQKLAREFVRNMVIGPKPNPAIVRARKRFGRFVDELLDKKEFDIKDFSAEKAGIIRQLAGMKWNLLYTSDEKKYKTIPLVGEMVRLGFYKNSPECVKLTEAIAEECWKLGCQTFEVPISDTRARRRLELTPRWSIAQMHPFSEAAASNIDVRITIGYEEDPEWMQGRECEARLASPAGQHLRLIHDKRKVKWCLFGWPCITNMKSLAVSKEKYRSVFIKSIEETFTSVVAKYVRYYGDCLEGADRIHITADDGTDLSFSIKGRVVLRSDGRLDKEKLAKGDFGLNIPDGEVFIAPIENSANGKILFDYAMPHGFGLIRNLWLTFKNGRVVSYSADGDGAKRFRKFLDANTGDKDRIAELGIGCNPAAEFIGATLVDEKIFGSVHVAIGNNTGAYHGKNRASSHEDFIKMMRGKKGNLEVDGRLVMRDGLPVKP